MKTYDLKTEEGQKAYFEDRQAILKKHKTEVAVDWKGKKAAFDSDCVHISGITADCLQDLIKNGFADPECAQNCAPSIQECLDFLQQHNKQSQLTAHGYMITPIRGDVRVSIEGIEGVLAQDDLRDFVELFRFADELSINTPDTFGQYTVRCWYD